MLNSIQPLKYRLPASNKSAALSAAVIVIVLCVLFEPIWDSNDDVAMSMIAHGYGIAAYSSPYLVFSNVLWGYLVSPLPTINGVVGYSWLTLTMLFVIAWSILYFLYRLEVGYFLALGAVLLIIVRAVCFPQFTVVAGLLTVSAVMGWITYAKTASTRILLVAMLLGFAGFLIRSQEFLFVLLVALPLLPWQVLFRDKWFLISVSGLVCCLLMAVVVDHQSYNSASWQAFHEFNPIRVQFTDFGAGDFLKNRPDLKNRFKYSDNDLDLLANWFFVDSTIVDSNKLSAMLKEVGLPTRLSNNRDSHSVLDALASLKNPDLLPLEIAMLGLILLTPRRWQVVWAIGIFLLVIFTLGLMGRSGILRVYYPAIALIVISPLALGCTSRSARTTKATAYGILVFACAIEFANVVPDNLSASATNKQIQIDMIKLKTAENHAPPYYIAWAQYFPFEYAYPLLRTPLDFHFYSLSSFTNAPFSISFIEEKTGHDLVKQLLSDIPVPIIATDELYHMLTIWCRERFNRKAQILPIDNLNSFEMAFVTCGNTQ